MKKIFLILLVSFLFSCGSDGPPPNTITITIDGITTSYSGSKTSSTTSVFGGDITANFNDPNYGLIEQGTTFVAFSRTQGQGFNTEFTFGTLVFDVPTAAPTSFTDQSEVLLDFIYFAGDVNNFTLYFMDTMNVNLERDDDRIVGSFTGTLCDDFLNCVPVNISGSFDVAREDLNTTDIPNAL